MDTSPRAVPQVPPEGEEVSSDRDADGRAEPLPSEALSASDLWVEDELLPAATARLEWHSARLNVVTASLGLAAVAVTSLGGYIAWSQRGDDKNALEGRHAVITKTPKGRGIKARVGPSKDSLYTTPRRVFKDGEFVKVVCQVRDGDPVSDPGEGRPLYAVGTWDRLSTGDWINDLYTDLPRKQGADPPKGIARC